MHEKQQSKKELAVFWVIGTYLLLQALDFATTLTGTSFGIQERNEILVEIAKIIGDVPALILAKAICIVPAILALRSQKTRALLVVFLILAVYYLDIVSGNFIAIYGILKA